MKNVRYYFVFILAITARVVMSLLTNYIVDDACITYRYAENIAAGSGFVYNIGERVLGTTTPLFTLLLALGNLIGIGSITFSHFVSFIFAGFTAVILLRWSEKIELGKLALLPALIYILFSRSVVSDISGLETALFTILFTSSLYFLYNKQYFYSILIASFAAITRPEGMALLLIAISISLWKHYKSFKYSIMFAIIIVGSWLLFAWTYFGSVIPNSLPAKVALYQLNDRFTIWEDFATAFCVNSIFGYPLWILFFIGLTIAFRKSLLLGLISLSLFAYLLLLVLSTRHIFFWYSAPVLPLIFLTAILGFKFILNKLSNLSAIFSTSNIKYIIYICVAVALILNLSRRITPLKDEMAWYQRVHISSAKYLNLNASGNDKVVAEDIGHFGYTYHGKIIDRDGLVTPAAIPYNLKLQPEIFIDSIAPDWLFIGTSTSIAQKIINSAKFKKSYKQVIPEQAEVKESHQLYKRIKINSE